MKIDIKLFLLFISVIVIFSLLHHNCNREKTTAITTTTAVIIDTLKLRDTVYFPKPYRVVELHTDTMYIDTSKTIHDYFTDKYYLLSFSDSLLQGTADIKISQNAIELAKFDYEIYRPTILTTTVITEKSVQRFFFSLGGGVNYNFTSKRVGLEMVAGIGIKRHHIHASYDFINQTPHLSWQYQIIRQ